jgi:inosose dehydratase
MDHKIVCPHDKIRIKKHTHIFLNIIVRPHNYKEEIYMFEGKDIHLGIAPIGWTNDDMPALGGNNTFEQCISEAALAGFEGTEIGGKYPQNPAVLKQAMALRGLKVASQWFSSFLCERSYEENEIAFKKQLDFLAAVGANRINVCELTRCLFASEESMFGPAKPRASDAEWDRLCKGLDKLGRIAAGRGFKLCYHHHMATVVQTVAETRRLMENTNPEYVYLCFDTGHFTFSGEDATAACKEFVARIGHVHLKDIRKAKMEQAIREGFKFRKAVLENCFTVPGDGCVDYPAIFNILDATGYEGWLLVEAEQNPAKANPFEYALKARQYIHSTTGL